VLTNQKINDNKMNQFESFETVGGTVVVVNKATITYIKGLSDGNSMIFFNAMSQDNKVQAVRVNCCIEEVERILNDE
jgi:hypothetical protein